MKILPHHLSWAVAAFFASIIAVVFHQISTTMTEQGIASGGPYNNAAAYPRAVAVTIAFLVAAQLVVEFATGRNADPALPCARLRDLKRPALLLVSFAVYLNLLPELGYHLTTAPLICSILWTCGERKPAKLLITSLAMAFIAAFFFEKVLNVVLPGGYFGLNIAW
ncbi:MAG: tripartite tricarboxylate transporter TctB family protein [Albidovulum sp.]|nr:tripartite tricarboxylate transporter TctB family protein [Albidovulum sp.]